ncbi:hypothetical protein OG365_31160 [Streptomyces sp. NBC_00853]|nr:hypothetical protein OG365_31160 [Streptomyces sp. NBC_00853]
MRKLGVTTYDMGPYRAEIQERHVFHLEWPNRPRAVAKPGGP